MLLILSKGKVLRELQFSKQDSHTLMSFSRLINFKVLQFLKNLDPIEEIDLFPIILINLNSLQSSNTDDLFKSRFLSHLIIISLILVSLNDSVPI